MPTLIARVPEPGPDEDEPAAEPVKVEDRALFSSELPAAPPKELYTDIASGPVALVHLGHRVPDGFHGNWVGAA